MMFIGSDCKLLHREKLGNVSSLYTGIASLMTSRPLPPPPWRYAGIARQVSSRCTWYWGGGRPRRQVYLLLYWRPTQQVARRTCCFIGRLAGTCCAIGGLVYSVFYANDYVCAFTLCQPNYRSPYAIPTKVTVDSLSLVSGI